MRATPEQSLAQAVLEHRTPTEDDLDLYVARLLGEGHQVFFKGELRTIVRWHHLPPSRTNPHGAVVLDFAEGTDGRARTGLFQPDTLLKAVV